MRRRELEELADRVAALEAVAGTAGERGALDDRLEAIEAVLRRLGGEDAGAGEALRASASLVSTYVPPGARLAIASETEIPRLAVEHHPAVSFGEPEFGAPPGCRFSDGVAAIAALEAERVRGTGFLLVPDPVREWLELLPELAEHLRGRYRLLADEPAAGLLFDLDAGRSAEGGELTLGEELDRLSDGDRYTPVLAWTERDVISLVPGRNVFTPLADDGELDYLDGTVDIVIVEDPGRLAEARRVAGAAVVRIEDRFGGGVGVVDVEDLRPEGADAHPGALVVVATPDADDPAVARVRQALGDRAEFRVVASSLPWETAADGDLVVVLEPGVLPLPGCIDALVGTLASGDGVAATVKLLDSSGRLAAAGGAVFADGSVAGIGAGSASAAAPWHEYTRAVWTAVGVIAIRGEAAGGLEGAGSLLAASARLWKGGPGLIYQPDAAAVLLGDAEPPDDPDAPPGIEAWEGALAGCPHRPHPLDEGAWRRLLVHSDAEEAWR